jgi:phage shock protein C
MNDDDPRDGRTPPPGGRERSDLQQAADRLEAAVEDLVKSASGTVSQKATRVVDELERTARRLRDQVDADPEDGDRHASRRARREARRAERHSGRRASKRNGWLRDLYREPERGWIAGVCAGLARYYEVEPWVARVVVFSLFLFIPAVFWAYVAAIFLLARRPRAEEMPREPSEAPRRYDRSPAPELGPRLAPRNGVRTLRVRFRDLELRLRRIEGYVTSREFTLTRELSELEHGDARGGASGG